MIDSFDEDLVRLANGFGGGIAEALDICGTVAASVMIIGAIYGRRNLTEDQSTSWRLCREFHRRFMEIFASTDCRDVREIQTGDSDWTHEKCAATVEIAIKLLLEILEEENNRALMSDSSEED